MPIEEIRFSPWTRKHDDPRFNLIPQAPRIVYPKSLGELIELCRNRPTDQQLKAAGSHWALSEAAISDHTFIETHDPRNVHQAMGRTLSNVIPKCLNRDFVQHMVETEGEPELKTYLVHVEAGKRIYQLYAELDQIIDVGDTSTLAGFINDQFNDPSYGGPWALATLGGAGGQTIVGAFNTGTHGGDFDRPPIADSVLAIHLVADGGKHYWIEAVSNDRPQLTDDFMMSIEFGITEFGGIGNFEIIRDNNVFNAVLVSAGRFGVIYSIVLKAAPQYSMYERRRLHIWQDIKHQIKDHKSPLYRDIAIPVNPVFTPSTSVVGDQRFLQIAVCLTPHLNFQRNLVGVTKRWQLALPTNPQGRMERVGDLIEAFNERIQAPLFEKAGASHGYRPDPDNPHKAAEGPSLLERACADASFLKGAIEGVIEEIKDFVDSNGTVVGAGIGAIAAAGGVGLLLLIPALLLILVILRELLDHFDDDTRLGEHMENIKNELLAPDDPDPLRSAAGLFVWQLLAYKIFESMQEDLDFEAISYAMMDRKDYLDECEVNVDSVEVFFDAADDRLIAFVDALIAYEIMQEFRGKAFVGYASLRFMGRSRALIGMQKFDITCAVEVACLRDVTGSQELVDYAVTLARNPNINGLLHWGQRNDWTRTEVERIYGDSRLNPGGNLGYWRQALSRITDNGRRHGFSSEFTRKTGLEVITPLIGTFIIDRPIVQLEENVTIIWDCTNNPPDTQIQIHIVKLSGIKVIKQLPLAGQHSFQATERGGHAVRLFATRVMPNNAIDREDSRTVFFSVV